nr:YadA-like family protein [Bartonella ancashensis]
MFNFKKNNGMRPYSFKRISLSQMSSLSGTVAIFLSSIVIFSASTALSNTDTTIEPTSLADVTLVKQNKNNNIITIGKEKGGKKINIVNNEGKGRIISGLARGKVAKSSTEAVNGSQLFRVKERLANFGDRFYDAHAEVAKYLGGGARFDDAQWVQDPIFSLFSFGENGLVTGGNRHRSVSDAFSGLNNSLVNIGNKFSGIQKDIGYLNTRADSLSSVIEDIGGIFNDLENKINDLENSIDGANNGATVVYDKDENGKKTNSLTLKGGDESKPVTIDSVADGKVEKGSKQAVNGGQLHDYTQEKMKIVLEDAKKYTDEKVKNIVVDAIDDAVDQANKYTDKRFSALSYDVRNAKKEARQAAAVGLAVSNLSYDDTPGKLSVSFGSGLWRSQSALAFGAGYMSESGKVRSNISATNTGGHWGIGAGLRITLN